MSALQGQGFRAVAVPRLYVSGLASSADGSSGVCIIGIDPAAEAPVSAIASRLITGRYFDGATGNRFWPEVIVVSRWPFRIDSGRSLSYISIIFGL